MKYTLLCCCVLLPSLLFAQAPSSPPDSGQAAPAFYARTFEDDKIKLTDLCGPDRQKRKGEAQVVVLSFFATWCVPCQKEIPVLHTIKEKYTGKDVTILLASIDEGGFDVLLDYVEEKGITLPILIDKNRVVARLYGAETIPTIFVIDKSGIIRYRHDGYLENIGEVLENVLQPLTQ